MSVQRFRGVEEMPPPEVSSRNLAARIRAVWGRARRFTPMGYPAGVYRFRSIEEAQTAREARIRERAKGLAAAGRFSTR